MINDRKYDIFNIVDFSICYNIFSFENFQYVDTLS